MAPHAEAAGQVQSLHSLRLHLTKNGLTHSLKLVVELIIDLWRAVGDAWGGILSMCPLSRVWAQTHGPSTVPGASWDTDPTWPVVKERP